MDLKVGDIILVKGRDLLGKTIDDIEHSKYSHSAIYIGSGKIVEAEWNKVICSPMEKYAGQADIFRPKFDLTIVQQSKIVEYAKSCVGEPYDYFLLLLELVRYALHVILPYKEHKKVICSVLVDDCYRKAGIELCPGVKYPSPADIAISKLIIKIGTV